MTKLRITTTTKTSTIKFIACITIAIIRTTIMISYYYYYVHLRASWKQYPAFWSAMLVNVYDGDGIRFLACNPKRQKTSAWQRYATYKVATTVFDALKLGRHAQIHHTRFEALLRLEASMGC